MIECISQTAEIEASLKSQNKIRDLDQPKHIAAMVKMNEKMNEVRKDYRVKDKKARIAASQVRLA